MPAHKRLTLKAEVRPAGRLSRCGHHKGHTIRKGEPRLVVTNPGPNARERGYCRACAHEMLDQAEAKLATLRSDLAEAGDLDGASVVPRAPEG